MSEDLVKRLTIKASIMEMGESIAWGSDTSIMREASARIEELEADIEMLESELASAVGVAFNRGAVDWVRLNYPKMYSNLKEPKR